jgi:hypothetical protein
VVEIGINEGVLDPATAQKTGGWVKIRNSVAHSLNAVGASEAEEIVEGVMAIIAEMNKPKRSGGKKK